MRFERARTHIVRPRANIRGAGISSGLQSLRGHAGTDISKMPIELIGAQGGLVGWRCIPGASRGEVCSKLFQAAPETARLTLKRLC